MTLDSLIRQIPKAELHLHIEGSLEPELMLEIAKRNKVTTKFKTVEEVHKAYKFENLQSFLDIYYQSSQVLLTEQDFYDLTWAYVSRVAKENVRHMEIFFDPQSHTGRGIKFDTVVTGIHNALKDASAKLGITSKLIMCFLRDSGADSALQTLEQALRYQEWIIGVGLDSAEVGYPPELFTAVFDRARAEGFLTVAHAGEEGPPEYIWQALKLLQVSRINHGVRCLEDEKLVHYLAEKRIPLTVCPLSNLKLKVVSSLKQHPLKKLLESGICATVNSDDPSYFGGYITDNFLETQKALELTEEDIVTLAKNSFEASFISREEKQSYFAQIDQLQRSVPVRN